MYTHILRRSAIYRRDKNICLVCLLYSCYMLYSCSVRRYNHIYIWVYIVPIFLYFFLRIHCSVEVYINYLVTPFTDFNESISGSCPFKSFVLHLCLTFLHFASIISTIAAFFFLFLPISTFLRASKVLSCVLF